MEPLFVFLDFETAFGSPLYADIIEIGAQIDPHVLKEETFSCLVKTDQELSAFVKYRCCIKCVELEDQRYFKDVFKEFLEWIQRVIKKAEQNKKKYFPVLVAHSGTDHDFTMIQSNLERHGLDTSLLSSFFFADTLYLAKKLRDGIGVSCLRDSQLSIEKLFNTLFPDQRLIGQHRALADVQFMIKIFLESPLKKYFDQHIVMHSYKQRCVFYEELCKSKKIVRDLNKEVVSCEAAAVTQNMTVARLKRNGYTREELQRVYQTSQSYLHFYNLMKQIGINRKGAKAIVTRFVSQGIYQFVDRNSDEENIDSGQTRSKKDDHTRANVSTEDQLAGISEDLQLEVNADNELGNSVEHQISVSIKDQFDVDKTQLLCEKGDVENLKNDVKNGRKIENEQKTVFSYRDILLGKKDNAEKTLLGCQLENRPSKTIEDRNVLEKNFEIEIVDNDKKVAINEIQNIVNDDTPKDEKEITSFNEKEERIISPQKMSSEEIAEVNKIFIEYSTSPKKQSSIWITETIEESNSDNRNHLSESTINRSPQQDVDIDSINNVFLNHISQMKQLKAEQETDRFRQFLTEEEVENWEEEVEEGGGFEIPLYPREHSVPTGMTLECFNADNNIQRVPLFNHFDDLNIDERPNILPPKKSKLKKKKSG